MGAGPMRTRIAAVLAALLLAGCAGATQRGTPPASSPRPAVPAPTTIVQPSSPAAPAILPPEAMLIAGHAGDPDLSVVDATSGRELMQLLAGAPMDDWSSLLAATRDGANTVLR